MFELKPKGSLPFVLKPKAAPRPKGNLKKVINQITKLRQFSPLLGGWILRHHIDKQSRQHGVNPAVVLQHFGLKELV